jgi:hypothetical protein
MSIAIRVLFAIVMSFAVVACAAASSRSQAPSDPMASPRIALLLPTPPASLCGSTTMSIDYAPYTTAILAGYGWDFVVADAVAFGPAFFNTADGQRPPEFGAKPSGHSRDPNREPRVYTPVDVVIERVINGRRIPGPSRFLIEGGTVGCFEMWVDAAPRVVPGSRYVFILTEAFDADGKDPLTDPKSVFAWPVDPSGQVTTVDGLMSIDELTEIVSAASPS